MLKFASLNRIVSINRCCCYHLCRQNVIPKPLLIRADIITLQSARNMAKGKDKKKEDRGKGVKKKLEINESFLGEVINVEKLKSELEHNLFKLSEIFLKYMTVRTTIGSLIQT